MTIELEKFITDLDEHLKIKSAELNSENNIKRSLSFLGNVEVRVFGEKWMKLCDVIDLQSLEKEMTAIITGARADIIYSYQDFAVNFMKQKESEENEGEGIDE